MFLSTLKKGGTIGIVAPAKPTDAETLAFCTKQLHDRGFKTKIAPNVTCKEGIFAGDERFRAQSFMECWCDKEVDAVWCFHGGYGCTPLLNHLDFAKLKKHPKVFIGMSDVTALHMALAKRCGFVTFLGPTLGVLFAEHRIKYLPFSEDALWQMVLEDSKSQVFSELERVRPGRAEGELVGGNLALICALMGTPWQVDMKGKILVLEDVNEPPYRIDRMLCQLKQGGLLDEVNGVILCSWQGCEGSDPSFTLSHVFERYFSKAPYPVVSGFPSGHIPHQVTLPLNAPVELDADQQRLLL